MLILNLKVNSHKTVNDIYHEKKKSETVYSSYSRKSSGNKTKKIEDEKDIVLASPQKTVLTKEQQKYLNIYEKDHDLLFGKNENDKTKIKVYVEVDK